MTDSAVWPNIEHDDAWADVRSQWELREGTTYLNHGSFGPPPKPVRAARQQWIDALDRQPMDFFHRQLKETLPEAAHRLARFVGCEQSDLALVENATAGMNAVAANVRLKPGDEVLLTDHEYGAVRRIWQRACDRAGAKLVIAELPFPPESDDAVVEAICGRVTGRTRLAVSSHITSPTALVLPADRITAALRERGVAVCLDGPHAVAKLPLDVRALDCDYYTASCHKWLSAPFGTGLLYVHPRRQQNFEPVNLSWGRLDGEPTACWNDEFWWSGTRDPSAFLALPAAIDFLESVGLDAFRARTHHLARLAAHRIGEITGLPAPVEVDHWHRGMTLAELPPGECKPLQQALWENYGIEIPVIPWQDRRFLRVSCHLYNTHRDIDRLVGALSELLAGEVGR